MRRRRSLGFSVRLLSLHAVGELLLLDSVIQKLAEWFTTSWMVTHLAQQRRCFQRAVPLTSFLVLDLRLDALSHYDDRLGLSEYVEI